MNAELARLLREGRWVQPTSAAGVLGIGAAAFLLSYDALHSLALASGVRPGLARIWPGVLDGFIVVATLTVVAAKRASRPTWYPWALVVLFSAASVAFNILHAIDQGLASAGWIAALVFAMPPVALVLASHLLLQQGVWRRQNTRTATAAGEAVSKGGTAPTADAMGATRGSETSPAVRTGSGSGGRGRSAVGACCAATISSGGCGDQGSRPTALCRSPSHWSQAHRRGPGPSPRYQRQLRAAAAARVPHQPPGPRQRQLEGGLM